MKKNNNKYYFLLKIKIIKIFNNKEKNNKELEFVE